MILAVPYYSQHADVQRPEWRSRACSVVCLKMVLDFFNTSAPSIDKLIDEGVAQGGYTSSGWSQKTIVDIARSYGVLLYRTEYRSEDEIKTGILSAIGEDLERFHTRAVADIEQSLMGGKPVMVSVVKNFTETEKFHMVVFTGMKMDGATLKGFYYHDPDAPSALEGARRFVSRRDWEGAWRRMAIFVKVYSA